MHGRKGLVVGAAHVLHYLVKVSQGKVTDSQLSPAEMQEFIARMEKDGRFRESMLSVLSISFFFEM